MRHYSPTDATPPKLPRNLFPHLVSGYASSVEDTLSIHLSTVLIAAAALPRLAAEQTTKVADVICMVPAKMHRVQDAALAERPEYKGCDSVDVELREVWIAAQASTLLGIGKLLPGRSCQAVLPR